VFQSTLSSKYQAVVSLLLAFTFSSTVGLYVPSSLKNKSQFQLSVILSSTVLFGCVCLADVFADTSGLFDTSVSKSTISDAVCVWFLSA